MQVKKKIEATLFEVVSQRIVTSTTTQNRCFLDVRAYITEDLRSVDLVIALCPSELRSAVLLKQVKFLYELLSTIPVAFNA